MFNVNFGEPFEKPFVIALGFFDCMHKGHLQLIERAKQLAKEKNCLCAIFTFQNNHFEVLNKSTKLIYTFAERLEIYKAVGVDVVFSAMFNKDFMSTSATDFLATLFKHNVEAVVCGFDYTCGRDMKNADFILEYAKKENTICDIVPQVSKDGTKISSTLVRNLLIEHKIDQANSILSEKYFILGSVNDGRKVGRRLGFPTANLLVNPEKLLVEGVYTCSCDIDGKAYKGILNIGSKPTFGVLEVGVEAFFADFQGDLYGRNLKIVVEKFLRDVQRFENAEQLIEQLQFDLKCI